MKASKGFTLIEIMVVLVIIGALAAITIPNLISSMEQTKAQAAKNDLLAISAAEQKYYEDYGYYCSNQNPNPNCGANPNSSLSVSTTANDPFNYSCTGSPYTCTATDGTVTLTATGSGGVSCTAGGGACPS